MTTIVVARRNGVAAIAADTLTKMGHCREPARYVANHEKIMRVGDSLVALSGSISWKLVLKEHFARIDTPPDLRSVAGIFRAWTALHGVMKKDYFLRPEENDDDDVESTRIAALIANSGGIFGVDGDRAVQEFTRFAASGGGREFALGAMYAAWQDPGLSAEQIARIGVAAASEFDEDTGEPVTVYTTSLR